jgi:hypothetical protein
VQTYYNLANFSLPRNVFRRRRRRTIIKAPRVVRLGVLHGLE